MGRKCLWAVALLSLLWICESPSFAGTVPTPPPGTGTPVTVPAPNPLDYNAVSGAVISSQQFNSNFWKNYNDMNAIAAALNGCGYSTGTGVTSVAATAPIMGSIGACVPGTGTTLTLSLASGVPYSGTYFTASDHQDAYRWVGTGAAAGHNIGLDSDSTGSINGVPCEVGRITDFTIPLQLFCVDDAGNFATLAQSVATGFRVRSGGVNYAVPRDDTAGGSTTHFDHDIVPITFSGGTYGCVSDPYLQAYATRPSLVMTLVGGLSVAGFATSDGGTLPGALSSATVCVFTFNPFTGTVNVSFLAYGV